VRPNAEEIRSSIRLAALAAFSQRGYHGTTLDEIAESVGMTRGAVLHHFRSKGALLSAVLDPCLRGLDVILEGTHVGNTPTAADRQGVLDALFELVLNHRAEVLLLSRDVGSRAQVAGAAKWSERTERLVSLLAGSEPSATDRVRVVAAFGALIHPVTSAEVDLDQPAPQTAWREACSAALGMPDRSRASQEDGAFETGSARLGRIVQEVTR
jgi:AcrR family transcriptional regulator